MDYETGKQTLADGSRGFRTPNALGWIALRLNDEAYMMTKENIILSKINMDTDIDLFDINSGDMGAMFSSRPDVNAFVFACTESSVKYSEDNKKLESSLNDFSEMVGPSISVIEAFTVRKCLNALKHNNGCLIKGSGIMGVGTCIEEAVACVQIIEKCCRAELLSDKLGGIHHLPQDTAAEARSYYVNRYSSVNSAEHVDYIGFDEDEFNLRSQLIEIGKQMCRDDLVHGSWGNASLLLNDHEMLITPSGMDYFSIRIEDIVKLDLDNFNYEDQRRPSRDARLHADIYKRIPECRSIIHTHSTSCSVFAACRAGFAVGDEQLREMIGDVLVTEYAEPGSADFIDSIVATLEKTHAAIVANHGAMFYGKSADEAIAIANAVETRATNILG